MVPLANSIDPLLSLPLMLGNTRERKKRLPAPVTVQQKPGLKRATKRTSQDRNGMKVTNRKLYNGDGLPFDPQNDLLDDDDLEDEQEEDDGDYYGDDDMDEDDDEEDFKLRVFPKSLLPSSSNNHFISKDVHLNNNPLSPTTTTFDTRSPHQHQHRQHLLDDNSREAVPLPGPPRDLIAQLVRSRFVTLSWLEPKKNPDEVVSYDVFYKTISSER